MGEVVARDDASQRPKAIEAQLFLFAARSSPLLHARSSQDCGAPPQGEWPMGAPGVYPAL